MLVKQFKNSPRSFRPVPAIDFVQKFICTATRANIFQQTTFFTQYLEHISKAVSDYLYHFCNFYLLLRSFNPKNRTCKQFSPKFLVRIFLILEIVQRFSRDLLLNHKEERKSAEILSRSTIFMPQLCFLGNFNLNQKVNFYTRANNFWR